MKKILTLVLLVLPFVAFGEVSQFVFVTSEQTVGLNVMSKAITIQSQNSGGLLEAVTETTDILFESSSPTGKFVGSGGKVASKTMSKNTARRTFYYIDSTPGTYTLTVKTTGRTSKKTFSLQQNIVVRDEVVATEVKSVSVPSAVLASAVPVKAVHVEPVSVPVKTKVPVKKEVKVAQPLLVQNQPTTASSTLETTETTELATIIYTASPRTSALESFFWLPKKIWSAVKSVFRSEKEG